jgi:hypothetical protein
MESKMRDVPLEIRVPRSKLEAAAESSEAAATLQIALGRAVLNEALRGLEGLRAESDELRARLTGASCGGEPKTYAWVSPTLEREGTV